MPTTITSMSGDEIREYLAQFHITNRISMETLVKLVLDGWKIDEEGYSMELVYKGFPLVVEFCIGDFCSYPCSKKGHWLLERKVQNMTFEDAMRSIEELKARIDAGYHWRGEDN